MQSVLAWAGSLAGRRGGSPERQGSEPNFPTSILTPKEEFAIQHPSAYVSDPRYLKVKQGIKELFSLATFGSSETYLVLPVKGSDLKQARGVTRFLPGAINTEVLSVEIDNGVRRGYYMVRGETRTRVIGSSLSVTIPRDERFRPNLKYKGVQISTKEYDLKEGDPYSAQRLHFERSPIDSGIQNLLKSREANPVLAVEQLQRVVKGLRAEFAQREAERAEDLLNPRQRGLVRAIMEKGMEIWARSQFEGADSTRNEFVLIGDIGENKKSTEIGVIFSASGDHRTWGEWTSRNVLEGLRISWPYKGRVLVGETHSFLDVGDQTEKYYDARGEINLERTHGGHRYLMDRMPVSIFHPKDLYKYDVGHLIRGYFENFLMARVGIEPQLKDRILLATSMPLVV